MSKSGAQPSASSSPTPDFLGAQMAHYSLLPACCFAPGSLCSGNYFLDSPWLEDGGCPSELDTRCDNYPHLAPDSAMPRCGLWGLGGFTMPLPMGEPSSVAAPCTATAHPSVWLEPLSPVPSLGPWHAGLPGPACGAHPCTGLSHLRQNIH